jgi:tRNA threonylcarbamoyl adenosine modification protein (Sua5/YciO/YrdC/YwlC family)
MPAARSGERAVADAAAATRRGELIVLPTDTVYGIGTRPDRAEATARLFEVKHRPHELALPVLAGSEEAARAVGRFDARAERLAGDLWPGALTLVLPRTALSGGWDLGGDPETVGVRVPRHPLALAVLGETGPLAVTSANLSGSRAATTCEELASAFGDVVAVYLCEEGPLDGRPSTVIDLAHGAPRVLRAGALEPERVELLLADEGRLAEEGPLLDSRPPP